MDPARVSVASSWQEAYDDADVFMTCTVSAAAYIDRRPKAGSLQLNVSLRDYKPEVFDWVKGAMIVDDWEEVCREKTDIEVFHQVNGLQKEGTISLAEAVCHDRLRGYAPEQPIMFNPMGMGVFDIATASYYYHLAGEQGVGTRLE